MYVCITFLKVKYFALYQIEKVDLFATGVLGDGFGTLRNGVFSQLSGQNQPNSSLNLSGGQSSFLVVPHQFPRLNGDSFKRVVDKGVHDAHCLGGDSSVGVNLLQYLVDVATVGLGPFSRFGKQNRMDVGQDPSRGYGDATQKLIEFFVITNS